jgi:hypothetical protein
MSTANYKSFLFSWFLIPALPDLTRWGTAPANHTPNTIAGLLKIFSHDFNNFSSFFYSDFFLGATAVPTRPISQSLALGFQSSARARHAMHACSRPDRGPFLAQPNKD